MIPCWFSSTQKGLMRNYYPSLCCPVPINIFLVPLILCPFLSSSSHLCLSFICLWASLSLLCPFSLIQLPLPPSSSPLPSSSDCLRFPSTFSLPPVHPSLPLSVKIMEAAFFPPRHRPGDELEPRVRYHFCRFCNTLCLYSCHKLRWQSLGEVAGGKAP